MAHGAVKHDYHILPPSPWPLVGSVAATIMAIGLIGWLKGGVLGIEKGNWAIFAAFFVFMSAQPDARAPVFLIFSTLMCAFTPATMLVREDRYKVMALSCSLPVTRRTIVGARYALTGALTIVGLAGAIAGGLAFTAALSGYPWYATATAAVGAFGFLLIRKLLATPGRIFD